MAAEMDRRTVRAKEALINSHREHRGDGGKEIRRFSRPLSSCLSFSLFSAALCGYSIPLSWYEKIPSYRDSLWDCALYSIEMLFLSTFPGGWPGVGLLLLRAAVGVVIVVQGAVCLVEGVNLKLGAWLIDVLAIACGVSLLAGFLTSLASILASLGGAGVALSWIPAPAPNLFDGKLSIIFVVIMAVAIFLIGPGAFSLDARLFGRREIIIPPTTPKS
jgi:uncharacterized membrane protein YphA (DoxX/SURF4 family)